MLGVAAAVGCAKLWCGFHLMHQCLLQGWAVSAACPELGCGALLLAGDQT